MPVAAIPAYLGRDFTSASPGLRFGMYLPIWTERTDQEREISDRASKRSREGFQVADLLRAKGMDATIAELQLRPSNPLPALWDKNDFAAHNAWDKILPLSATDKATMAALIQRQSRTAQASADVFTLDAIATAPFTAGLGNEHPLENGFAFLNPYGLPYLPGSGIKGVLRQAARELASGEWGEAYGWTTTADYRLVVKAGKPVALTMLDALFGLESGDGDKNHVRGALSFWDAIPQIPGDSLAVDIMTPHQSHYYQPKRDRKSGDSASPHDSGQPNPICFLTLPPGTQFAFHVQCDLSHLERLAPNLAHDKRWQQLLTAAFEHAFEWLGFGAKTAVGYGAMQRDESAQQRREAAAKEQRRKEQEILQAQQHAQALQAMAPADREIQQCLDQRTDPNMSEIAALMGALKKGQWDGALKQEIASKLRDRMQQAGKWKEKSTKKKPEKDYAYQDTLQVQRWIAGQ